MERYDRYPNVHWLDFRSYEQIPGYGSAFDVALMPWLDNDWIKHANPIKMKEYLALGLAVVSTDFPEVERYRDVIRIASGEADFIDQVRLTLKDGGLKTPAERRAAVLTASWDSRARELMQLAEGR
jgi:glycosyltransferase involved in cell wall biosynthesis